MIIHLTGSSERCVFFLKLIALGLISLLWFSHSPYAETGEGSPSATDLVRPLNDAADLDSLIEAAGDRRLVLLGEASHGTREFYTWRDQISRRLIEEKNFSFIAVEGDWAALQRLNRYVKDDAVNESSAREVLLSFDRWPVWMWANEEIVELAEWLREYNLSIPTEKRVGIHGLDIYGPWESMREVVRFFEYHGEDQAKEVRDLYSLWARFENDGQGYARSVFALQPSAEEDVQRVVQKLRDIRPERESPGMDAWFQAKQNAKVVANAELHFRSMTIQGPANWNARASHMKRTATRLLDVYGPESRGIVWAHNTHVGDARATTMARHGQVNIGHLARERLGEDKVLIVGFGTGKGTVVAGREWGGEVEVMQTPKAIEGSIENLLHGMADGDFWILFDDETRDGILSMPRGHRAIGVIYHADREHLGNYVPTILTQRYDAFIYLKETEALAPLN